MTDIATIDTMTDPKLGTQPIEVAEFVDALASAPPNALTACPGRTVHTLGAHVAGNYCEITRHVDAYLRGTPLTRTRTFDEREPEFRVLPPDRLLRSIVDGDDRMRPSLAEF